MVAAAFQVSGTSGILLDAGFFDEEGRSSALLVSVSRLFRTLVRIMLVCV